MKTQPISIQFADLSRFKPLLEPSATPTDFWNELYKGFAEMLANDETFLDAITPKVVERAKKVKQQQKDGK